MRTRQSGILKFRAWGQCWADALPQNGVRNGWPACDRRRRNGIAECGPKHRAHIPTLSAARAFAAHEEPAASVAARDDRGSGSVSGAARLGRGAAALAAARHARARGTHGPGAPVLREPHAGKGRGGAAAGRRAGRGRRGARGCSAAAAEAGPRTSPPACRGAESFAWSPL